MIKKLKNWHKRASKNNFEAFPQLLDFLKSNEENLNGEIGSLIATHLQQLQDTFRDYFPQPDTKLSWIRDPFTIQPDELEGLTIDEEDQLLDLSTQGVWKQEFDRLPLMSFWARLRDDAPLLAERALKVLLPFPTTYLCEAAFSALLMTKNKYRNRLNYVEPELRIQLSDIDPSIDKLVTEAQPQRSH